MLMMSLLLGASLAAGGTWLAHQQPADGRREGNKREVRFSSETGPLRIAIAGLSHGHVEGLLWQAGQRKDIKLVGIYEPDKSLFDTLAAKYKLDAGLWQANLDQMLERAKPEAVSVMGAIKDHLPVVEVCAARGVHVLVEKPLAFSGEDARRMAALAEQHGILVLTNYETSWYASVREAKRMVESGERGPIRKMIFRHGHKGPIEIGCQAWFTTWLTDPQANGGGAVIDFGCYGAVLATWLMDGQKPTQIVASRARLKPLVYPKVDDDATIVLTYPTATAVIQASWAWTHDNKEMDLHTQRGSIHAGKWDELGVREENGPLKPVKPRAMGEQMKDEWTYLREVVRGKCAVDPLSSLELNVIAAEILDVARQAPIATSR